MKVDPRERAWLLRDKYAGQETADFMVDVKRLEAGEPLDYVIGWRDFLGCRIDLSERPLIPRVETEFWTEKVVNKIGRGSARVLDIFSGSGCVGLAILKHCPNTQVTFIDSEENCVRQIKKNLKMNGLEGRVFQADIFLGDKASTDFFKPRPTRQNFLIKNLGGREPNHLEIKNVLRDKSSYFETDFREAQNKFDFILANPPYVPKKGRGSRVQTSTALYEPTSALWSGDDGLDVIQRFLKEAKNYLAPDGEIWLEFGYGQKTKIEKIIKAEGYRQYQFHRDQFNRYRFVVISYKSVFHGNLPTAGRSQRGF